MADSSVTDISVIGICMDRRLPDPLTEITTSLQKCPHTEMSAYRRVRIPQCPPKSYRNVLCQNVLCRTVRHRTVCKPCLLQLPIAEGDCRQTTCIVPLAVAAPTCGHTCLHRTTPIGTSELWFIMQISQLTSLTLWNQ